MKDKQKLYNWKASDLRQRSFGVIQNVHIHTYEWHVQYDVFRHISRHKHKIEWLLYDK